MSFASLFTSKKDLQKEKALVLLSMTHPHANNVSDSRIRLRHESNTLLEVFYAIGTRLSIDPVIDANGKFTVLHLAEVDIGEYEFVDKWYKYSNPSYTKTYTKKIDTGKLNRKFKIEPGKINYLGNHRVDITEKRHPCTFCMRDSYSLESLKFSASNQIERDVKLMKNKFNNMSF